MGNSISRRLHRLERERAKEQKLELAIVVCEPGETSEQAWARELAIRPAIATAKCRYIINLNCYAK